MRLWDKNKVHETSLSDSEDEGTGGRRHRRSHKSPNGDAKKKRSASPTRTNGAFNGVGTSGTTTPAEVVPPTTAADSATSATIAISNPSLTSGGLNQPPHGTAITSAIANDTISANTPVETVDTVRTTSVNADNKKAEDGDIEMS